MMADKEVVVKFRLERDQGNPTSMRGMAAEAKQAQADITAAYRQGAADRANIDRNSRGRDSARQERIRDFEKELKDQERLRTQNERAERIATDRAWKQRIRDDNRWIKEAQKTLKERDDFVTGQATGRNKDLTAGGDSERKAASDAIRRGMEERAALERKHQKERDDFVTGQAAGRNKDMTAGGDAERKAASDAIRRGMEERAALERQQEEGSERAGATYDRAARMQEIAGRRVVASSLMAVRGVLQLARGVAMLGLVGEKDTQKLVDGLIKIQFGFDAVRGGINIVVALSRTWAAVEKATKAAAVAQEAYAAAEAVGGAAGLVKPAMGLAGIVGGSKLAMLGLGSAAVAGGAAGTAAMWLTGREAMKYGIGGGATPGSLVDNVGGSHWNPFYYAHADWEGGGRGGSGPSPYRQLLASEEKLKQRIESDRLRRENEQVRESAGTYQAQRLEASWLNDEATAGRLAVGNSPDMRAISRANQLVRLAKGRVSTASADYAENPSIAALQSQQAAQGNLIQAVQERARLTLQTVQNEGAILERMIGQKRALEDQQKARDREMGSNARRWLNMTPEGRELYRRGVEKAKAGELLTDEEYSAAQIAGQGIRDRIAARDSQEVNQQNPSFIPDQVDPDQQRQMADHATMVARETANASKRLGDLGLKGLDLNTGILDLTKAIESYTDTATKTLESAVDAIRSSLSTLGTQVADLQSSRSLDAVIQQGKNMTSGK